MLKRKDLGLAAMQIATNLVVVFNLDHYGLVSYALATAKVVDIYRENGVSMDKWEMTRLSDGKVMAFCSQNSDYLDAEHTALQTYLAQ